LAAVRFNTNESAKFSPFFLLYNRDVVLPIDNILQPRRKYLGEEPHLIALEHQHKSFRAVHRHLKRAKRRQAAYANRGRKEVTLGIGDPVYFKNNLKKNKLQSNWKPFYRIIEKRGPVSFIVKNQLDGKTTKAHADQLKLAQVDEWEIPTNTNDRQLRDATYAVPPDSLDDDVVSEPEREPLRDIVRRHRRERDNSSSEDDIPLMELSKRLKERERRNNATVSAITKTDSSVTSDSSTSGDDSSSNSDTATDSASEEPVRKLVKKGRKRTSKSGADKAAALKILLAAVVSAM